MAKASDILIYKGGRGYSIIGQEVYYNGKWRGMKGGTAIYKNGQWYLFQEPLNMDLAITIDGGTQAVATVKSTASLPYRPAGVYNLNGQPMTATVGMDLIAYFTDGSSDLFQMSFDFTCDAQAHIFRKNTPKKCYKLIISGVTIAPAGLGEYAYRQGNIRQSVEGWHPSVNVSVSPSGAGTASVSNPSPLYGTSVVLQATETDRNTWRFVRWSSGQKAIAYGKTIFDNYTDTAIFADASKVIDFSMIFYVNAAGQVCIEAKTLQNRDSVQFATITLDIPYMDTTGGGHVLTGYTFELTVNGQEIIRTVEGIQGAGEVSIPQNVEIQPPGTWQVADIYTEADNNRYSIEVSSANENQGTVRANPEQVPRNGSSVVTATPKTGYILSRWEKHTPAEASFTLSKIRAGYTDTAYFALRPFALRALVASGQDSYGTATVSPASVTIGGSATWNATPRAGYKFVKWTFSDGATYTTASVTRTNISADLTGTASFALSTVTVDVIGGIGMDFDESGNPAYYRITVSTTPDIAGTVVMGISGYVTFSDGDVEPFEGEITEVDQYYISTTIRYREDRYINGGQMQAWINTPGYVVGTVTFHASERMAQDSLAAGYSLWDLTADDDDAIE